MIRRLPTWVPGCSGDWIELIGATEMRERVPTVALLLLAAAILIVSGMSLLSRPVRQVDMAGTKPIVYRINPNEAGRDTLSLLPGIARGKAQRIINERQAHGAFSDIDDITRVPMIAEKTAAGFEPWVRFD